MSKAYFMIFDALILALFFLSLSFSTVSAKEWKDIVSLKSSKAEVDWSKRTPKLGVQGIQNKRSSIWTQQTTSRDSWQGIGPLRSTRADVERLLGQPTENLSPSSVFYRTPNETIVITYTDGLPCGIGEKYSRWRVPRDTVQSILVTPTKQLPVSKLALEERKYQKRGGGHLSDSFYYMNDDDGVSIRVFMDNVMSISLYPGKKDAHLSCFPPTATTDCEGLAPPAMDSYRSPTIQQERLRLDNFAIALLNSPDATGYIIAYGGKSARAGEANVSNERAKRYLTEIRHLSPVRLKVINGGFREKSEVELFVLPLGTCPPVADPTVDPRDIQITRSHKSDPKRRRSPH